MQLLWKRKNVIRHLIEDLGISCDDSDEPDEE